MSTGIRFLFPPEKYCWGYKHRTLRPLWRVQYPVSNQIHKYSLSFNFFSHAGSIIILSLPLFNNLCESFNTK